MITAIVRFKMPEGTTLEEATKQEVGDTFGDGAGDRARDDYPTIVFRVRQVDDQRA